MTHLNGNGQLTASTNGVRPTAPKAPKPCCDYCRAAQRDLENDLMRVLGELGRVTGLVQADIRESRALLAAGST